MLFEWIVVLTLFYHCSNRVTAFGKLDDLSYDENHRLSTHYLLYSGEGCGPLRSLQLAFREVHEITNELKRLFFRNTTVTLGSCTMVCLERGTLYEHVLHPTPQQHHTSRAGEDPLDWITPNCQAAELGFISYLRNDATVYWIDDNGNQVDVGPLKPGERNTFWIGSYLGHKFDVVNNLNESDVYHFVVQYNSVNAIGHYVSGMMERDVDQQVYNTFESEWARAHQVRRTFTPFGFNKGKLPLSLFASMSAYYYNNRFAATVEEWEQKGVFVNWWERDVFFISMPFKLKKYWQSQLKDLVEAWAGVELDLTDIYGMRRYEDGARLLTHVDRVNTHACSLIINVAQLDMRSPWTIEIYDFADRLHEIEMAEGDIVFYESARCLHGRMQPLQGKHYVNLFAHYRPKGDPHWYMKENPAGTPEPVLDIGKCHSNGTKASCDGHFVPSLSPKLETLHGPQDLYNFWKNTASPKVTDDILAPRPHSEL